MEKKQILTYSILILLIFFASLNKIIPYLAYNYYYLIGFDSGKYVYDLTYKSSVSIEDLDLWVEPGLNTNLVALTTLTPIAPIDVYKYLLPIFVSIYFILIVFIFTREITKSNIAGIFSSCFISISIVFLNSTFDSYYRQIFGTIIFMTMIFYLYKCYRDNEYRLNMLILIGILGAGVIISHRAITLLLIISLIIILLIYLINKNFNKIKYIFAILLTSILLSSIYWVSIVNDNLVVLREATTASVAGKSGGNATIKKLSRDDNQLIGYINSVPFSFLPVLALVYITFKKRIAFITPFIIFLLIYIYFKASFSNRFILNLEILLSIPVGIYTYFLYRNIKKRIIIPIMILVFVVGTTYVIIESLNRKPYLNDKTTSIVWIENNIDKDKSLIIAPDALSTILTESGFNTAFYKYPTKVGSGIDIPKINEEILANSCGDQSLVRGKFNKNIDVYVVFDLWFIGSPLPRAGVPIPFEQWNKCQYYTKVYNGDDYIKGVYKLKKEYQ